MGCCPAASRSPARCPLPFRWSSDAPESDSGAFGKVSAFHGDLTRRVTALTVPSGVRSRSGDYKVIGSAAWTFGPASPGPGEQTNAAMIRRRLRVNQIAGDRFVIRDAPICRWRHAD